MPRSATPCVAQRSSARDWAARGRRNVARARSPTSTSASASQGPRRPAGARRRARLERAADRLDAVDAPRKEWELRYTITGAPRPTSSRTFVRAGWSAADFRIGPVTSARPRRADRRLRRQRQRQDDPAPGAARRAPAHSGRRSLGTASRSESSTSSASLLDPDDPSSTSSDRGPAGRGPRPRCGRCWPSSASAPSTSSARPAASRWASGRGR